MSTNAETNKTRIFITKKFGRTAQCSCFSFINIIELKVFIITGSSDPSISLNQNALDRRRILSLNEEEEEGE